MAYNYLYEHGWRDLSMINNPQHKEMSPVLTLVIIRAENITSSKKEKKGLLWIGMKNEFWRILVEIKLIMQNILINLCFELLQQTFIMSHAHEPCTTQLILFFRLAQTNIQNPGDNYLARTPAGTPPYALSFFFWRFCPIFNVLFSYFLCSFIFSTRVFK